MGQKILVAMDDSENARRAVEFVAKNFNPEHEITLFCVLPDTAAICDMNSPELTPYFLSERTAFCTLEDKKKSLVTEALQKATRILVDAGFAEDKITVKAETKEKGIARDIAREAGKGYDVVVMGKRGLSGIKEFLLGSVSQKVLHAVKDQTFLLVN